MFLSGSSYQHPLAAVAPSTAINHQYFCSISIAAVSAAVQFTALGARPSSHSSLPLPLVGIAAGPYGWIHRWGCLRSTCFPKASPCHSPGSCGSRSSSSSFVAIKATAYTATFLSWCASQPLSLQLLFLLLPLLFLYLTNSAVQTKNQDLERSCVLGLGNLGITFVSEAREAALYLGFCSNGTWVCALPTCLLSAPLGHNWKTASSRMFQRCFWFPLSLCKHASPQ